MADLSLTFENLYDEVLKYLGTYNSDSPTATALTDAKFIVNRAYSRFVSYFDWSFLTQSRALETVDGKWMYELPLDFNYMVGQKFVNNDYPSIVQRSSNYIRELRADNIYENYPFYYALQAGNYNVQTGQGWEVWFYPTPDSAYKLQYFCKINPQKLVNDADVPIGGPEMSDCLLELCLAYAEQYKEERKAVHNEVVNDILTPAKLMDSRRRPAYLGNLSDGIVSEPIDSDSVHSGDVLVST